MFGTKPKARRLNRLALRALATGDPAAAEGMARRSLALCPGRPKNFGAAVGRADTLMTLAAIADAGSNHTASAERLQDAVTLIRQLPVSPARDKWLAELLIRLGTSLRLAGRFGDARSALTAARALIHFDKLEPERRAGALTALGILAKDTGKYTEAVVFYRQAQAILDSAPDTVPLLMACLHHNMAGLFHVQGLHTEAEPEIRAALAIRRRTGPPDSDGVAADLSVLGAVLNGQGRLDEAEEALIAAHRIWLSRYGPDHYEVAVQLNNIGSVQHQRRDFDAATASYREALQIKDRVLGGQHPEIAALLNNIASLEVDQGREAEAKAHYARALTIFHQTLGQDHPSTRICAANLAHLVA